MLNDDISDIALLGVIGKRINAYRLKNHWTQAQLAMESGVSKRTIERLESGESVQLTNWIRILRALSLLPSLEPLLFDNSDGDEARPATPLARRLKAAKNISDSWPYKGESVEGLECYSRYKYPESNK